MSDEIRFKTREEGYSKEISVYIVTGVNMEGHKEVLRFYIDESETSRYWFTVFNGIKNKRFKKDFNFSKW